MERGPTILARHGGTEEFNRARLRRCREREEREVGLVGASSHRLVELVLGRDPFTGLFLLGDLESSLLGACAERRLQIPGGLSGLRRMRLVDDHGVVAATDPVDLVQHERERLKRAHHDPGLLATEGLGELRRLGAALALDPHDHPGHRLELCDRRGELVVEHATVGDDNDLVEHRLVVVVMELRETMGEPGDRVGLARPSRVLSQVSAPRPTLPSIGLEAEDAVPLVVPGEDHLPGRLAGLVDLGVHEAAEQVEERVPLHT